MEYAYNDYVVAQLALSLGEHTDYEQLMKNSENFRMVIDSAGTCNPPPNPFPADLCVTACSAARCGFSSWPSREPELGRGRRRV